MRIVQFGADLTPDGLDQKLLLRSDGTAVLYDAGSGDCVDRHKEFNFDKNIYVVEMNKNYHFQVLKALSKEWVIAGADGLIHFSYGMD